MRFARCTSMKKSVTEVYLVRPKVCTAASVPLSLSPVDSDICVRGLIVSWVFVFETSLDPDLMRESLSEALVAYPIIAGRASLRARRSLRMELDIILEDAGVAFELESSDLTRNEFVGEKSQRTHLKAQRPSRFFCDSVRPIRAFHSAVRCSGTLMASKLTILKGTGSVLGISWSHSICDGNAMMTFINYWAFLCRHKRHSVLASLRTLQIPSHDRLGVVDCARGNVRPFPAIRGAQDELQISFSGCALKLQAAGEFANIAMTRLAQERIYFSSADVAALKRAFHNHTAIHLGGEGYLSANDAVVCFLWCFLRRLKRYRKDAANVYSYKSCLCMIWRQLMAPSFDSERIDNFGSFAIQAINMRGREICGFNPEMFGNASMMSVSKLSEDRVYPGAMLRSIRYSVMRAKNTPREQLRGTILGLVNSCDDEVLRLSLFSLQLADSFSSSWQFPLWKVDFGIGGRHDLKPHPELLKISGINYPHSRPVWFSGTVYPQAPFTSCVVPQEGGRDICVNVTVPANLVDILGEYASGVVAELREI